MIGVHYYSKVYLYTYVNDYIIEIGRVSTWVLPKKKLVYRGFLGYLMSAHGSWFLMKGAPPRYLTFST